MGNRLVGEQNTCLTSAAASAVSSSNLVLWMSAELPATLQFGVMPAAVSVGGLCVEYLGCTVGRSVRMCCTQLSTWHLGCVECSQVASGQAADAW